ncbi:MAG: GNAT family N-acetyltransferase [Candidatus Omnitrophota bacterium]
MSIETKVFNKIEEISPQEWNSVFPDSLEGYYFFKSLDESGFTQFQFRYILVYDNKSLIGTAPCFLMDFPMDAAVQGVGREVVNFIKKFLPSVFNIRALLCGLPMDRGRLGFLNKDAQKDVIEGISRAMFSIAKEEDARVVAFKDFDSAYLHLLDPLLNKGFFKMESLPSTVMEINFSSFQEHLLGLSAVSRYDLRRKFRKVDRSGLKIKMQVTPRLDNEELAQVYELYLQTVNRQDMGFEIAPMEFFRVISENMPTQAKYFLWRINNKLVGFALCLSSQDYFIDLYLGFDYSVAYQYHLYFIKIRDLMNWCAENNFKTYEMGMTNYEPKKRLDFKFIPLYTYVRHRNRLANPFLKILGGFFSPLNFDPTLKKMKQEGKL